MLRPWNAGEVGTCEEDHYSLGCKSWRRRMAAPRDARGPVADVPALMQAQKRKLSNLFAEATHRQQSTVASLSSRSMTEADVVQVCAAAHLAAAGVSYDDGHELVQAARAWFAFFSSAAAADAPENQQAGMTLRQFLKAATGVLAADEAELPEVITALPALQFKLAAGGAYRGAGRTAEGGTNADRTAGQLSKPQFVAWRMATGRLTAAQLSAATQIDGIGGSEPSLDDVFAGADCGHKKALTADDWARTAERFWCRGEPWDEMNAYAL